MELTMLQLLSLFFIYSFAGWLVETAAASIFKRSFINKGYLSLPLCPVYGLEAAAFSIFLPELRDRPFFLFLGGMILCAFFTLTTGRILERLLHRRWWSYRKFQFEGYLSLPVMVLCGLWAVFCIRWGNPLFLGLLSLAPDNVLRLCLMVLGALLALDFSGSSLTLWQLRQKLKRMAKAQPAPSGSLLTRRIERRLAHAYPSLRPEDGSFVLPQARIKGTFAQGCCFYKLAWLFFLGSLLGDLTETVFCYLTAGVLMSRSSLVYGPFSIVWGLGCVMLTAFLYRYKDRSDRFIFFAGTVLGGAYEYMCSVFSELVFGAVFWDYSHIPFNLGGRINLLYCFFWGIAAVVWLKGLYPRLSALIEHIPYSIGISSTWLLVLFMVFNMGISSLALARYTNRQTAAAPPQGAVERFLDEHFPDERMERIYPNAKVVQQAERPAPRAY